MFKLTCTNTFTSYISRKGTFYIEKQQNLKPTNLLKKPLLFIKTIMLLKMLATKHSIAHISYSIFNYIPEGDGMPPWLWEADVFDGLCKLVSLYTNQAFPPQSIIFRKPKITDTFRDPILVTESK